MTASMCFSPGTLYHLMLDLVSAPQISNDISKLILCHRFSRTNFVLSVLLCFSFGFCHCALNTQQGGYVRVTSLIIIIISSRWLTCISWVRSSKLLWYQRLHLVSVVITCVHLRCIKFQTMSYVLLCLYNNYSLNLICHNLLMLSQ